MRSGRTQRERARRVAVSGTGRGSADRVPCMVSPLGFVSFISIPFVSITLGAEIFKIGQVECGQWELLVEITEPGAVSRGRLPEGGCGLRDGLCARRALMPRQRHANADVGASVARCRGQPP